MLHQLPSNKQFARLRRKISELLFAPTTCKSSAAKSNTPLRFNLRNVKTGEYRYFYAHENNILFDKLHLLCTKADLITIQEKIEKFDIVEQCTQERQNTKWRFKLITNVTFFAAILKNGPMGCPDSVFPET